MKFTLLLLLISASLQSQVGTKQNLAITKADYSFLKTDGNFIRNNDGKGNIINLRGTNLGSWLSFEYWMMPLGTGALDRSNWKLISSSSKNETSPSNILDGNTQSVWRIINENNPTLQPSFTIDMQKDVLFNRIRIEANLAENPQQKFQIEVSSDNVVWEIVSKFSQSKDSIINLNILKKRYMKITQLKPISYSWEISEINLFMEDDLHVRRALENRFGIKKADQLLDSFQDSWITTFDLYQIQNMGMNVVRVPFFWKEIMNEDGTIKTNGFKQLDWIIKECKKRQVYVILDLHGAPGGINGYITSGEASTNNYWTELENQNRTKTIWKSIAKRYKGNPTVAMYGVLNEPRVSEKAQVPKADNYAEKISFFYNDLYKTIREEDPDHIICFNAFYDFNDILPPTGNGTYNWKNVVYEVHYYAEENKKNPENMAKTIDGLLLRMEDHKIKWNVPVFLGEFNCWQDFGNWEKFISGLNKIGISWTNWAYKTTRIDTNPAENWGYYQGHSDLPSAPDLLKDDFKTIKNRWKSFSTESLIPNKNLIDIVSKHTH